MSSRANYARQDQLFDRGLFMLSKPNFGTNSNYLVYNQFCRPKAIILKNVNYVVHLWRTIAIISDNNNYFVQNQICRPKSIMLSVQNQFCPSKAIMLSKAYFGAKSNYIVHNQFCWTKCNYVVQKQLCCPQSLLSNKSNYCVQDRGQKQV